MHLFELKDEIRLFLIEREEHNFVRMTDFPQINVLNEIQFVMSTKTFLWNLRRYFSYLSGLERKKKLSALESFFKKRKYDSCENQMRCCVCNALSRDGIMYAGHKVSEHSWTPHTRCNSKKKEYLEHSEVSNCALLDHNYSILLRGDHYPAFVFAVSLLFQKNIFPHIYYYS